MDERSQSGDVDKLVSDFLSELNALSESLGSVAAKAEPATVGESDAGAAAPGTGVVPEQLQVPAVEPEPEQPVYNQNHCRNIDILLMDQVQATPLRKKPDDFEFPYSYRSMYRSRFWLFRGRRILWAGAVVALACGIAAVYVFDPLGLLGEFRSKTAASASGPVPTLEAIAVDEILPPYPARARRLGIRGVVEVQADVDETGKVVRAIPVSGPAQLRSAAAQAVTKCRFKPATRDGVTIKSTVTIPVSFKP